MRKFKVGATNAPPSRESRSATSETRPGQDVNNTASQIESGNKTWIPSSLGHAEGLPGMRPPKTRAKGASAQKATNLGNVNVFVSYINLL